MELITRRVIRELEGGDPSEEVLREYSDPNSEKYAAMLEVIRERLHFTTLQYCRLDDMLDAIGLDPDQVCTYCWDGKK